MSADYTGLHGRSPYETVETGEHFVPEGWEELDRGICPKCGRTVRRDAGKARWVRAKELRVLVLTQDEVGTVLDRVNRAGSPGPAIGFAIEAQLGLQEEVRE